MDAGGTDSVSQTPLSETKNVRPASCITLASTHGNAAGPRADRQGDRAIGARMDMVPSLPRQTLAQDTGQESSRGAVIENIGWRSGRARRQSNDLGSRVYGCGRH